MNKESCSIFEQIIKEINDCLEHEFFSLHLEWHSPSLTSVEKPHIQQTLSPVDTSNGQTSILVLMKRMTVLMELICLI